MRLRRPAPKRSTVVPAAADVVLNILAQQRQAAPPAPSRRPRACSFAISRWPTVSATTA